MKKKKKKWHKKKKKKKKKKKNDNDNVNYFVNSLTLKHCKRNKILNWLISRTS